MEVYAQTLITVLCTFIASSGFWAFISNEREKKSVKSKMLLGLGHDRIIVLGREYIKQGWISKDDYENLHDYLYVPYKQMGGNGSAERIMKEVEKLPIK